MAYTILIMHAIIPSLVRSSLTNGPVLEMSLLTLSPNIELSALLS